MRKYVNTGPFKGTDQVLSVGQVARRCCVAPRTVAKWIDGGQLTGYLVGRCRRVERGVLVQFMRTRGMPLGDLAAEPRLLCCGLPAPLWRALVPLLPGWTMIDAQDCAVTAGLLAERYHPAAVLAGCGLPRWQLMRLPAALAELAARLVAVVGDDCPEAEWLGLGYAAVFKESADPALVAAAVMEDACQTNHSPPLSRPSSPRTGGGR